MHRQHNNKLTRLTSKRLDCFARGAHEFLVKVIINGTMLIYSSLFVAKVFADQSAELLNAIVLHMSIFSQIAQNKWPIIQLNTPRTIRSIKRAGVYISSNKSSQYQGLIGRVKNL